MILLCNWLFIKSVISQYVRQSVSQSLVNGADTISRHGPLNSKVCEVVKSLSVKVRPIS